MKKFIEFIMKKFMEEEKNSLNSIVNKIKSKIHNEETTRAEKLQILTLVPSDWSRKQQKFLK